MKPQKKHEHIAYRIIHRSSGTAVGSYSRACHDEYDFESVESARNANWHGVFRRRSQYAIAKYRVIYELIEPDCPVDYTEEDSMRDTMLEVMEEYERTHNGEFPPIILPNP